MTILMPKWLRSASGIQLTMALSNRQSACIKYLRAIEETGLLEDSLIIMVSDHGGGGEHAYQHGSDHPSDKTIFWGCTGPGIKPNTSLQGELVITDTAEVVIRALGLNSRSWEAKLPEGLFNE
jgi:hypothetical protein